MIASTFKCLACVAPLLGLAVAAPAPNAPAHDWQPSASAWAGAAPGGWSPHGAHAPSACSAVTVTVTAAAAGASSTSTMSAAGSLPTVDLGYEIHQAIAFNDTGAYYNFSNIRYAAPPTGQNRFRAPLPPVQNRSVIQTGNEMRICPQATPSWILSASSWIANYAAGMPINITLAGTEAVNASLTTANALSMIPPAPGSTEDCLFLDVMVPKTIFDNAPKNSSGGAPVLVWIYGGGYTLGSKTGSGNPAGILARSMTHGREGVIFVALNYRLGAMGWLAGPTFQEDATANAGLYDQRFALEWVQRNIHLFGGDPKKVTLIGESAGGGSIMHQITAYGGLKSAPFNQAIMQSPGFLPQGSNNQLENQYNSFLSIANVSNINQLRNLSTEALQAANLVAVWQSHWGTFDFGPAVDGYFVPALPGKLLLDGNFNKEINVMVGHNLNEGLLFTDPFINDTSSFLSYLRQELPAASDMVVNHIVNDLYPASAFPNFISRIALIQSEISFTCNTKYLDSAYMNKTYSYYFTVPPGLHGTDIQYTFYNGGSVVNATAAIALQDWITTFAETGVPSSPDVPNAPVFTMYGPNDQVLNLAGASITRQNDSISDARCNFWQKGLYV